MTLKIKKRENEKKTVRMGLLLTQTLAKKIKAIAEKEGVSCNDFISQVVNLFIDKGYEPKPIQTEKRTAVSSWVTNGQRKRLDELAKQQGINKSQLINRLIMKELGENE